MAKYSISNNRASTNDFTVQADSSKVDNMFANTKSFKDVTSYKLMRGVPDFGSLVQFNPYETGYAAFIVCQMPKFIDVLAKYNQDYNKLIKNWQHIIEYEFKSFSGIEDITVESMQLGDDLNNINVINKVTLQGASTFTLSYEEKSGSPLTKFAKLYTTGIKDGRTQVKTYHGLIHNGILEDGFENEVFTFLFIATDNTMRKVEFSTLIIGAQLTNCQQSIYNYTKGDINKQDIDVTFTGYPIMNSKIDAAAQDMLSFLISTDAKARQIVVNSDEFNYTGIDIVGKTLSKYGADPNVYPTAGVADQTSTYTTSEFYTHTNL